MDPLGFLESCRAQGDVVFLPYGPEVDVLVWSSGSGAFLLMHPQDIKHVLVTNQENYVKWAVPPAEAAECGQGLLRGEGLLHQQRRRLIIPMLGPPHYRRVLDIVGRCAQSALEGWVGMPRFELNRAMTDVTLAVIWEVLFDGPLAGPAADVYDAIQVAQETLSVQYRSVGTQLAPLWVSILRHWRFARGVRRLDHLIAEAVRRTRKRPAGSGGVLGALLAARDENGRALSNREIRDDVVTLLLAGQETTANALARVWILSAGRTEIQERLREETSSASCRTRAVRGMRCSGCTRLPGCCTPVGRGRLIGCRGERCSRPARMS